MTWKEMLQFDIGKFFGFSPRSDKPPRSKRGRRKPPRYWKGPIYGWITRDHDLYQCTRQLAAIVKANAPLIEGIQMASEDATSGRLKNVFLALVRDLDEGMSLSESMRLRSRFFPKAYVDQIEIAEMTGQLSPTLFRLSDQIRPELHLKFPWNFLKHPYFLLFLGGWSIGLGFLPLKVYPVFIDMLRSFDVETPKSIVMLSAVSDRLPQIGPVIALLFLLPLLIKEMSFLPLIGTVIRRASARVLWLTPFIGTMVAKCELAEASHALRNLLTAGLPLHEALEDVSKRDMAHIRTSAFGRLARSVESGTSLRNALGRERTSLPRSFRSLVALGETSVTLPRVLGELDILYRGQADRARKAIAKLYVPFLTFMLAAVTLATAVGMFELNVAMVNAILMDM